MNQIQHYREMADKHFRIAQNYEKLANDLSELDGDIRLTKVEVTSVKQIMQHQSDETDTKYMGRRVGYKKVNMGIAKAITEFIREHYLDREPVSYDVIKAALYKDYPNMTRTNLHNTMHRIPVKAGYHVQPIGRDKYRVTSSKSQQNG